MTKSRQSVTRLRLSRLVRCLLFLGCIKLAIMGAAVLDLPMPAWFGSSQPEKQATPEIAIAEVEAPEVIPVPQIVEPAPQAEPEKVLEELPQGSAAAELAAAAKPRRASAAQPTALPAPLLTAGSVNPILPEDKPLLSDFLPEPEPLGVPLARAGVVMPETATVAQTKQEENFWDTLGLKSLPIPGLGGIQVAHAAALDMPVPQAPQTASPFTPAEQIAPLGGQGRVLPGAPDFPQNIPAATSAGDGAPLPPRQPTMSQIDGTGYRPQAPAVQSAPAPNVTPQPSPLNPNMKAQELARQQQDILMLRQQMDQRLKDLQTAEDKVKDMLREAKDVEDKKVKSLVQMYANMKPRTAAQALENMDERVAVRILSGMAPKQSGEILTYTNPVKTAKFTEMITRLRMAE